MKRRIIQIHHRRHTPTRSLLRTPTLSPLDKGGEGREWGDSARAGICELWLDDWYYINRVSKRYDWRNRYPIPDGELSAFAVGGVGD